LRGSIVNTSFLTVTMMNFLRFSTTTERFWNVRFRRLRVKAKNRRIDRTWTTKQKKRKPLSLKYHIMILFMCHISELFRSYLYCRLCHKHDNHCSRSSGALRCKNPNILFFCRFCRFEVHFQNQPVWWFCPSIRVFAKCPKMAIFDTFKLLLPFSNVWFLFSNCLLHKKMVWTQG